MRFLFTTLQFVETDFYGRVSRELERMGHECAHAVYSRQGAEQLRLGGFTTWCVADLIEEAGRDLDVPAEVERIESTYDIPAIRRVHLTDPPVRNRPEAELTERSVRHFLALERVFDEAKPDVLVPEVGRETMRQVATLIAERAASRTSTSTSRSSRTRCFCSRTTRTGRSWIPRRSGADTEERDEVGRSSTATRSGRSRSTSTARAGCGRTSCGSSPATSA